jgi:hypothetical protein
MEAYEAQLRAAEVASAERPKPAPRLSHAARTIHLRAYADRDYREQNPNWRAHAEEMIEIANLLVGPQLDTTLHLDGSRSWERECAPAEQASCLAELRTLDAGDTDVWVVGLLGARAGLSREFDELSSAEPLGRHLLVHGMSDRDAEDDFNMSQDGLRSAELEALHRERRRHKGALSLLHAFGHSLGSLHTAETVTVMHPSYTPEQATFEAESSKLLTGMIDDRLRGEDERQVRAKYRLWLEQNPGAFVPEEQRAMLTALDDVRAEDAAIALRARELDDPELVVLSDQDRQLYRGALDRAREGKTEAALASALDLATRYPKVRPLQSFACDLGKQGSPEDLSVEPTCARAAALAKTP